VGGGFSPRRGGRCGSAASRAKAPSHRDRAYAAMQAEFANIIGNLLCCSRPRSEPNVKRFCCASRADTGGMRRRAPSIPPYAFTEDRFNRLRKHSLGKGGTRGIWQRQTSRTSSKCSLSFLVIGRSGRGFAKGRIQSKLAGALWEGALARDAVVAVEALRRGLKPPPTEIDAYAAMQVEFADIIWEPLSCSRTA